MIAGFGAEPRGIAGFGAEPRGIAGFGAARGIAGERFEERSRFGAAVFAVGTIRERFERGLRFVVSTEAHEGERAVVARLGREPTVWRRREITIPRDERPRGIVRLEVKTM